MTLGSTQPLTEMSTRSISWGKGGRCVRLTTLPPFCAVVLKSGEPVTLWTTPATLCSCSNADVRRLPELLTRTEVGYLVATLLPSFRKLPTSWVRHRRFKTNAVQPVTSHHVVSVCVQLTRTRSCPKWRRCWVT